jgi:TldD protein
VTLVTDLRNHRASLRATVDDLLRAAPYATALAQTRAGISCRVGTRSTEVEPVAPVSGVVLSAWTGERLLEVAVPSLQSAEVKAAGARLLAMIAEEGVARGGLRIDPGSPLEEEFVVAEREPAQAMPIKDKLARAALVRDRLQGLDARVVSAFARATDTRTQELFVGPTRTLYQDLRRAELVALVVMEEGAKTANLHGGGGGQGGAEHFNLRDADSAALVEDCARLLGAERVEGGTYDCVFDGDVAGLFAHEAFGHGTEADMFTRRRAKGAQYLGQQVASELVDMFDDPALEKQAGSYFFDHEGALASRTQIIEKGVLKRPMTDLVSATKLGVARTANGRRESVARKAYTRMSNTFFGPGQGTLEDLVARLGDGLLVRRSRNGMEDPKGWGIQCEAYLAEEVRGGKRTGKVFGPIIITGYVPDLLRSIDGVSADVHISGLGMCGKGYKEWVKVTDGGPALKLKARIA